ncbi:hypothetical protein V5O48_006534 [Marasmius crinis-equi]|uniref:Fungal N-terminal domain-containing protein n=1 Tax=Marasmius crinis-equi TaxID=585013 RepID=A0ABR3FJ99_9AGAR
MPRIKLKLSSRPSTSSALNHAKTLVNLAKESTASFPIPGLAILFATVSHILDTAQNVRANQEECILLATRSSEMVLSIRETMNAESGGLKNERLEANIAKFISELQKISSFMEKQITVSLKDRFLNSNKIEAAIKDHNTILDDAWKSFQACKMFIHSGTCSVINIQQQISAIRHQNESQASTDGDFRLLGKGDVFLGDLLQVYIDNNGDEIQEYEGKVHSQSMIVRRYQSSAEMNDYLKIARKVWHPAVEQVFGYSRPESNFIFSVIHGGKQRAVEYLASLSPVERFTETIRISLETVEAYNFLWQEGGFDGLDGSSSVLTLLLDDETKRTSVSCSNLRLHDSNGEVASRHLKKASRQQYFLSQESVPAELVESNVRPHLSQENQYRALKAVHHVLRSIKPVEIDLQKLKEAWATLITPRRYTGILSTSASDAVSIGDLGFWTRDREFVRVRNVRSEPELGSVCVNIPGWKQSWNSLEILDVARFNGKTRYTFPWRTRWTVPSIAFDDIEYVQETHRAAMWLLDNLTDLAVTYSVPVEQNLTLRLFTVTATGRCAWMTARQKKDALAEVSVKPTKIYCYHDAESSAFSAYWSPSEDFDSPEISASELYTTVGVFSNTLITPIFEYLSVTAIEGEALKQMSPCRSIDGSPRMAELVSETSEISESPRTQGTSRVFPGPNSHSVENLIFNKTTLDK